MRQLIALEQVATTGSGQTTPAHITLAHLRTLRAKVASPAHANAGYYLHRSMEAMLCGFNTTGNTNYVVSGSLDGEPRLDGYPVRFVEALPHYSVATAPSQGQVVFGDLRYHWLGCCGDIRIDLSTQAGFTTDEILVRALERFTTGLMADNALAVLQLAAQ